jgi:site-specific recombinase XerD
VGRQFGRRRAAFAANGQRLLHRVPIAVLVDDVVIKLLHDLRHTLGTWLNSRGTDINVIKNVLGHRDIATTQRYLHVGVDIGRKELDDKLNFNLSAPRE